jgi:precorrin isomerase
MSIIGDVIPLERRGKAIGMVTMAFSLAAIIGMPVGFVGAAESKEALAEYGEIPFIIVKGRKGGSAMAAAVVNALASEIE